MAILIARTRIELKEALATLRKGQSASEKPSVGFVPTMGALHAGHVKLMENSVNQNTLTVVSVFVNPKQFGPNEDLSKYPRTFENDCATCEQAGVQILFAPHVDELYPESFKTTVSVSDMDKVLCGAYRPSHFDGVCTVVLLLLNLVNADRAYFGLKDFQQFSILRRMVEDLAHPTELVPVATVRDSDGLALSSRNRFLDALARKSAGHIPAALKKVASQYIKGERNTQALLDAARAGLSDVHGIELQYCELRHVHDLSECGETLRRDSVLALAAFVRGNDGVTTRLIDNLLLSDQPGNLDELKSFASNSALES